MDRREVLRILTMAAGAAQFTGFSKWAYACGHVGNAATQIKPATYKPQFFSAAEYEMVERLTDIIVPSDGTPGARETGVAEFVDFMVFSDPSIQYAFRTGLTWINAQCESSLGKSFMQVAPEQQVAALEPLAYRAKFRPGDEDGRAFFTLLREYTVMGYYTSELGLKQLDWPGLRFYSASPECPHKDDPEHLHLPAAQS